MKLLSSFVAVLAMLLAAMLATGGAAAAPPAPILTSIAPDGGSTEGAAGISLYGSNFVDDGTSVSFGSLSGTNVVVHDGGWLTVDAPVSTPGTVAVVVTTEGGSSAPMSFTYATPPSPPSVTGLSVNAGPTAGGTSVTLTGTGFTVGMGVKFGSTPAYVDSVPNATTAIVVSPAGTAGAVFVYASNGHGSSTGSAANTFTYLDAPTATQLSPTHAAYGGGSSITLTGSGFVAGSTIVTIDGNDVPAGVSTDTTLSFVAPAHAIGAVDVTVSTPGGTSSPQTLTFIAPPVAGSLGTTSGSSLGGTSVTVLGGNFIAGETTVSMAGTVVPASVNHGASLTFTTPPGAPGLTDVTITTPGGTTGPVGGGFTYLEAPVVTSISPASGPLSGGSIRINGTGFTNVYNVKIGASTITTFAVYDDYIMVWAPATTIEGPVDVIVTTAVDSSAADGPQYSYVDGPIAASLSPANGPAAGGTAVTITGSNFFEGATIVTIGGISLPTEALRIESNTELSFDTPAHAPGNVTVSVSTTAGSFTVPGGYTYDPLPGPPQASIDVETIQNSFSVIAANASSRAINSAVSKGISIGLSSGSAVNVGLESAYFAYAPGQGTPALDGIVAAEDQAAGDDRWSVWLDAQGAGLIDLVTGSDSAGWQVNVTGGVGLRLTESFLVGVLGGYERFTYEGTNPVGTLSGEGFTLGSYFGLKATENVLVDLSIAWTGLGYDARSGAADGSFDASRWLMSGGLAGTYQLGERLTLVPSARLSALWEQQSGWTDSLGTDHPDRAFGNASLSAGLEIAYALPIADGWDLVPYVGAYLDVRASYDSAAAASLQDGATGRLSSGLDLTAPGGASIAIGGDVSGLGTNLLSWSLQGTAGARF